MLIEDCTAVVFEKTDLENPDMSLIKKTVAIFCPSRIFFQRRAQIS